MCVAPPSVGYTVSASELKSCDSLLLMAPPPPPLPIPVLQVSWCKEQRAVWEVIPWVEGQKGAAGEIQQVKDDQMKGWW